MRGWAVTETPNGGTQAFAENWRFRDVFSKDVVKLGEPSILFDLSGGAFRFMQNGISLDKVVGKSLSMVVFTKTQRDGNSKRRDRVGGKNCEPIDLSWTSDCYECQEDRGTQHHCDDQRSRLR